jgi:hypothetical protein
VAMADYRDLWKGLCCIWRHVPRGGYGFALRIPVQIVDIGTRHGLKVRIEASGKIVTVKPESIILPPTMRGVRVEAEYDGGKIAAKGGRS